MSSSFVFMLVANVHGYEFGDGPAFLVAFCAPKRAGALARIQPCYYFTVKIIKSAQIELIYSHCWQ